MVAFSDPFHCVARRRRGVRPLAALLLLISLSAGAAIFAAGISFDRPPQNADKGQTLELQPESIVGPTLEALALLNVAIELRSRGELDGARQQLEEALLLVESAATQLGDGRRPYLNSKQPLYDIYIDVLMRLHEREPNAGHAAVALAASERGRERSLLDGLAEARANRRQDVNRDLLARERALQAHVNAAAERALLRDSTSTEHGFARSSSGDAEHVEDALRQYRAVRRQIRANNLRFGALFQFDMLDAQGIQQLLDDETVLLEYWLGEERSVVWAITRGGIEAASLAPRARISGLARRAYDEIANPHTSKMQPGTATLDLGDMLLAPVARQLQAKRVLVVADGPLQNLAFAALLMPEMPGRARRLFIEDHEIAYLPSVSALAALRANSSVTRPVPTWTIAVIGDPVFSAEDPRVKRLTRSEMRPRTESVDGEQPAERAAREFGVMRAGARLPRLPFSYREVDAILRLVPSSMAMKAVGFAASRENVTDGSLARARIVHFATHGLLHPVHPLLSGIVLSLVDERGAPQDGFLRLHDIYNLDLAAELVVLSACHTAFSEESDILGVIGLTRGFMYAGTPRVIASLWKVDDEATAELMKHFYQRLLSADKVSAASALSAAQSQLQRSRRWSSPFYWAGFVLQGDWR